MDQAEAARDAGGRTSAWVPGPRTVRNPIGAGKLSGLTFGVKDVFDVAGAATTYGSRDWARDHPFPAADAAAVLELLWAGARLIGKTKTVELASGLSGENAWHGTPLNPAAPDRLPGGSSCGSAAAVAGGEADFALGIDTGGSVRVPASWCGVFGMRPTHAAIGLAGVRALAPSLDAAGWFAADADVLARVGEVLLPPGPSDGLGLLLRPSDVWLHADPAVAAALSRAVARLGQAFAKPAEIRLAPEGLGRLHDCYRAVQAQEAWATLGAWITAARPELEPAVADRLRMSSLLDPAEAAAASVRRRELQARLWALLDGGAVLMFPTTPCPAPRVDADAAQLASVREATVGVTAIASLCGLPEVTLPVARVGGAPVGLSLVAGRGRDCALLTLAREAAGVLGLPASAAA